MVERLENLEQQVQRHQVILDGNGEEGLRYSVRELQEVMFGGTARVPKEESIFAMGKIVRDTQTRIDTMRRILTWLGLGTLSGLVYLILTIRGIL